MFRLSRNPVDRAYDIAFLCRIVVLVCVLIGLLVLPGCSDNSAVNEKIRVHNCVAHNDCQ